MNLKSLTQPEIGQLLKEMGQPAFRAKQIYTWLHKGVRSYDEMGNVPKALRQLLEEKLPKFTKANWQVMPLHVEFQGARIIAEE